MNFLDPEHPNYNCYRYNSSKQSLCFILSRWISSKKMNVAVPKKTSWQLLVGFLIPSKVYQSR